jgi:hypothetical protein
LAVEGAKRDFNFEENYECMQKCLKLIEVFKADASKTQENRELVEDGVLNGIAEITYVEKKYN